MVEYPEFSDIIGKMPEYLRELESCPIIRMETEQQRDSLSGKLPGKAGIYVLYEDGKPLYTGRSNRLSGRLLEHSRPSGVSASATFAFILAKKAYILGKNDIKKARILAEKGCNDTPITREQLQNKPGFESLFYDAKKCIRKMDIRAVAIQDPIEQTIFEVYAHLALKTPFNSFDNH